jgi:hypothetical protein
MWIEKEKVDREGRDKWREKEKLVREGRDR